MSTLLLFSLLLVAPDDSAQTPLRPVAAADQATRAEFEASLCPLGFCPVPVRGGLPPGVMFLATGLVGMGVAGLVNRNDRRRG